MKSNHPPLDFLLLAEDYHKSYTDYVKNDPQCTSRTYHDAVERAYSEFIYYGDAYRNTLRERGLRAEQIIPGCIPLQKKWLRENLTRNLACLGHLVISKLPFINKSLVPNTRPTYDPWFEVASAQIRQFRPRTLWIFSGVPVTEKLLKKWRPWVQTIILWWSCPLVPGYPYQSFDLILSSIPHLVSHFEHLGLPAQYLAHAFDARVLKHVSRRPQKILKALFTGSFFPEHAQRIKFLDAVSCKVPIDFYGYGVENLPLDSPLRENPQKGVWGKKLYQLLGSYLITLHHNIDVAGNEASAKRLFEATGMGSCVLTQYSDKLRDFFEPGKEIVTYNSIDECIIKIRDLLDHPQNAIEIGRRAQQRTLMQHTYAKRVDHMLNYLKPTTLRGSQ